MSFLFRNVTAVITRDLTDEFALSAGDLGLLTSAYFLSFALMQVPVGVLLDRYGPRRVEALLLMTAAAAALAFGLATGFGELTLARAAIGVGVSACLMGAIKAFTLWFPLDRLATLNGWIIAAGGLGGLAATTPVAALAGEYGWRVAFFTLAALAALVSATLWFTVPERALPGAGEGWRAAFARTLRLYRERVFWRITLPMVTVQAQYQALAGLWFAPWLADAGGLDRAGVAGALFWAAVAYALASVIFGAGADALARVGVSRLTTMKAGTVAAVLVFALIVFGAPVAPPLLLAALGFFCLGPVLGYALLTRHYAPEMTGRVNTAMNMAVFSSSFATQWGVGLVLHDFPAGDGRYAVEGYTLAFGILLALQAATLVWLLMTRREPGVHAGHLR